jgi:hypothetical protein
MSVTDDRLAQRQLRRRGTGELVQRLSQQVSLLVRQEVELAKAEVSEKGKQAGLGAGMLAGAAIAAVMTLGALTAAAILTLELAMPAWAAALIVTALWAAITSVLALQGRAKVQRVGKPVPEKTIESVKEDVEWTKDRMKSGLR